MAAYAPEENVGKMVVKQEEVHFGSENEFFRKIEEFLLKLFV